MNRRSLRVTLRPEDDTPALQLISTADMKTYLKVDGSTDDAIIAQMIQAATEGMNEYLRRTILTTTYQFSLDGFSNYNTDELDKLGPGVHTASKIHVLGSPDTIGLPMPPIQSVTSIVTYNVDNTSSTFSNTNYIVDLEGGRVALNQGEVWPQNLRDYNAVLVTYIAGYGDTAADVPKPITQAVQMWVVKMYESRGYCEMPDLCKKLVESYKLYDSLGYM